MNKIKNQIRLLMNGKVLILPFDTVWGLTGNAQNQTIINTIFKLKNRLPEKPISILLPRLDYFTEIYQNYGKFLKKYLPGPYTLLVKTSQPPDLAMGCWKKKNKDYTIGLRLIEQNFLIQKICSQLDMPLAATSANLAGENPAINFIQAKKFYRQLPDAMKSRVTLIHSQDTVSGEPSKIIDLTGSQPKEYTRK